MDKISVIVPCFNEEESIPLFYKEVKKALEGIENIDYEFVFINDGSSDHSEEVLRLLSVRDPHCHFYAFSRNFGKEAAMYAGMKESSGDYCVIMDADLQHPPILLKQMYEACKYEGYDCCGGKRVSREGEGLIRNFLSKMFYKVIQKMSKMEMGDGEGDFRMMSRQMVDALLAMKEYNRYSKGLFSFVGFDTKWIEFHNVERVAGHSKWNFKSLMNYAVQGIFSFSTTPLLISGYIGMGLMVLDILMLIMMLISSGSVSGIGLVLFVVIMLSALNMIFVSILGTYVSKDYLETKNRPLYIIKESSNNSHA